MRDGIPHDLASKVVLSPREFSSSKLRLLELPDVVTVNWARSRKLTGIILILVTVRIYIYIYIVYNFNGIYTVHNIFMTNYDHQIPIPNALCMEYLPTFGSFLG